MRIKRFMAVFGLCLFGLIGLTWAETREEASAFCVTCHDDEDLPEWRRSAHSVFSDKRAPDCVSCHGLSPTHARMPTGAKERPKPDHSFDKTSTLSAGQRSDLCLTCHNKDAKRFLWAGSQHQHADVACSGCHKVHTSRDKATSKATQAEVCYSCHKTQRAQLNKPSHHPIPEGKMTCSDCHNAHGSAGPKLVTRDSINDTCYTCHAEKRGPFVQAHQPVEEDCSICHNSHGSTVQAMLKARPPMLCQQCHTPHVAGGVGAVGGQPGVFPPAGPGATTSQITAISSGKNVVNIWQGRSCANCHTQVHGSNNPSNTNPTPRLLLR